jgi:hypothetical protein
LANAFTLKAGDDLLLSNSDNDYYLRLGVVGVEDTDTTNSVVYDKDG